MSILKPGLVMGNGAGKVAEPTTAETAPAPTAPEAVATPTAEPAEPAPAEAASAATSEPALTRFSWRLGRFFTMYSTGMGLQLVFGLLTTLLVINYLTPAQYGTLGLYLLVPSTVLVLANIGLLQGTNHVVFLHGGDDADAALADGQKGAGDAARRAFGTGIVVSLISGTIVAGVVIALAPELASALGNAPNGETLVIIGAISGALAGGWRLASNVMRYARKPGTWMVAHVSRAVLSLIAIVILLSAGHSVEGVILGFGIGTLLSFLLCLWIARRHIKPAFDVSFARQIARFAAGWSIIVIAYHVLLTGGIYIVSLNASKTQVGLYSLALSLAVVAHYAVSASVYAVGPLRRSPLNLAALRETGEPQANAAVFESYVVMMTTLILFLGVFANELIRLTPHAYAGAAALVPVLALPAMCRGLFAFTYSLSSQHDRRLFKQMAALALVLYLILAPLMGAQWHAYGVAAAAVIAFFIPASIQFVLTQRRGTPLPLDKRRMLIPPLLVAILIPFEIALPIGTGWAAIAVKLAICVAYLAVLLALDILPRQALLGRVRREPLEARRRVRRAMRALAPSDVGLLKSLVRERLPIEAVATLRDQSETTVLGRFLALLCSLAGITRPAALHPEVGRYLLFRGQYSTRDHLGTSLIARGSDPEVIDRLEQVMSQLRRLPRWSWVGRGSTELGDGVVVLLSPADALGDSAAAPDFVRAALDDDGDDHF